MKRNTIASALVLFFAVAAQADDLVQFHGFGGWSYGRSQDLTFLGATTKGNANNAQFALNVTAKPYERLNVVAQVNLRSDENEVDLDYAFADYAIKDQLKLRIGRVKHPLGLYGEVYDVGTVRPFQYLPRSIYGENGFTAKAYNGAGLTGLSRRGAWEIQYDVYGGEIDGDYAIPYIPPGTTPDPNASPFINYGIRYREVVGARMNLTTPVDGLLIGVSAYRGKEDFIGRTLSATVDRTVVLGSAEYARGGAAVRAEWGRGDSKKLHVHEGGYIEASYRITPKWQLAARYDSLEFDPIGFGNLLDGPYYRVRDHEDRAFGVNYWLSSNIVLRANYHLTRGNRFMYPRTNRELRDAIDARNLDPESSALIVGAQFSF